MTLLGAGTKLRTSNKPVNPLQMCITTHLLTPIVLITHKIRLQNTGKYKLIYLLQQSQMVQSEINNN